MMLLAFDVASKQSFLTQFQGASAKVRRKARRTREMYKSYGGTPLAVLGSPWSYWPSSGSCLGSLELVKNTLS